MYVALVRPCFDFACVVYHSMLSGTQSDALERMQRKILKIIYGYDESYSRCLSRAGIDYLSVRRSNLSERFALKTARNPNFSHWFPKNPPNPYMLRKSNVYHEYNTRTERLRSAPIYMYRRLLNAQESREELE